MTVVPSAYAPEPLAEWRRPEVVARFAAQVAEQAGAAPVQVPAFVDGERFDTAATIESLDPGATQRLVGRSASVDAADADRAVAAAEAVAERWRATPAVERAALLFRTGEVLRGRRFRIAALEVFEAGKPWDQADADVCEAIDFCEYYGREILRLDAGGVVQSPPGESNRLSYQGKGVTAVIAPWNFPLAIPTGMTVAAIAAGCPAILKPAEQTPVVALALLDALLDAGAPRGVIQLLPGRGEVVGARLVEHPGVAVVAFTGSKAVGLAINEAAARPAAGQRHVKRVVAEMGGKNSLLVDSDADLDVAVPAAVSSAFGYAGQKCSAASILVVHERIHDQTVERVVGATAELVVGHPSDPAVVVGPLIEESAQSRLREAVEAARRDGEVRFHRDEVPEDGWYVSPTVVSHLAPDSRLLSDELFGPLLAVVAATDLDHAIALANTTDYALTAGIFSRSPGNVEEAIRRLRAGNIYVNRSTTGAVVGRQPFGGYGMSGVGSKAGGPDYLLQFLDPRTVSENTMRQGFAP